MLDIGEVYFLLEIEIARDRSQKSYIDQILERLNMQNYLSGEAPINKGDKYCVPQSPKTE